MKTFVASEMKESSNALETKSLQSSKVLERDGVAVKELSKTFKTSDVLELNLFAKQTIRFIHQLQETTRQEQENLLDYAQSLAPMAKFTFDEIHSIAKER